MGRDTLAPAVGGGACEIVSTGGLASPHAHEAAAGARPHNAGIEDIPADQRVALEESFKSLRTRLLSDARKGARSFLFASATPSEGKSTVAANLACALTAVGRTVILIDADLRRPRLHTFFDLTNGEGLTEVLGGVSRAAETWQTTPDGPAVLTSGSHTGEPQYLLQSDRFATVLATAREHFEFVLIDTAPVLSVDDACLLASQADRTILVVKYGAASETDLREAVERLQSAGACIAGSVMSQVTDDADAYHAYGAAYMKAIPTRPSRPI
jgi:capsular exopolysaccharide synthesis family protein